MAAQLVFEMMVWVANASPESRGN